MIVAHHCRIVVVPGLRLGCRLKVPDIFLAETTKQPDLLAADGQSSIGTEYEFN